jgi:CBS-domain-containing membrane protein
MQRNLRQITNEFREHWINYVLQSLLAAVTIAIVIVFLNLENAVVVASIGATAFIVFAMPRSITAKPRNVIGGQMAGLVSGSLCAMIPHAYFYQEVLIYSLAVGISIFIMVVVDVEHPPASGTALGVAVTGFSWKVALALITAVIILSLVHRLFRSVIRDLV